MRTESSSAAGEQDSSGDAEYQRQFLDEPGNVFRGLGAAVPVSLVFWVVIGIVLWAVRGSK